MPTDLIILAMKNLYSTIFRLLLEELQQSLADVKEFIFYYI